MGWDELKNLILLLQLMQKQIPQPVKIIGPRDDGNRRLFSDPSELFRRHVFKMCFGQGPAEINAEVLHVFERKCPGACLRLEMDEVRALDVVHHDRGPGIFFHRAKFNAAHLDAPNVPEIEAISRHGAEHGRLRVGVLSFRRLDRRIFACAATLIVNDDVAQTNVLNFMAGNAAEDRAEPPAGIVSNQIADADAPQPSDGSTCRPAHAAAQTHENGQVGNAAHRDVADGNIFQQRAIHGLQRQSAAVLKNAVRDGNVPEPAVRFRTALDAAGGETPFAFRPWLERAVKHGAELKTTGHVTVDDGQIFRRTRITQRELTVMLERRTLWQQSTSIPSRSVSKITLSTVRLSTPVARTQKWPPFNTEMSRIVTLWQFFRLMVLSPTPGFDSPRPRVRPLPQIRPGPRIETS